LTEQVPGPRTHETTLPAEAASIAAARHLLDRALAEAGIDAETRFNALLVTSELVSNAVRHGSRPGDEVDFEFTVSQRRVSVCVGDAARTPALPVALTPGDERTEGRGLQLVDRLAEWSEQIVGGRRRLRATLEVP
jgi:anti-sigma regulatory factor (Ser/Thr protein kinase)